MTGIIWSNIELLIIDLDNTLCDTFHTLSKPQWVHVERALEKRGWGQYAALLKKKFGKQPFKHVLETSGMTRAQIRYAIKIYDDVNVRHLRMFPDAKELLEVRVPKVLLSRGEPALQKRKIAHLKLRAHFDDVVIINTFEDKQAALRAILKRHHVSPTHALVIGDRIEEEIADARALKIPCVLVRRPGWPVHKGKKPDLTVRSLRQVAKHFS